MSTFHKFCRQALLLGATQADSLVSEDAAPPPIALHSVVLAYSDQKRAFDVTASRYGNFYRSAYWASYLLSSVAVALALLTLGLPHHSGLFVALELITVFTILLIYLIGSKNRWHAKWLDSRRQAELLRYKPLITLLDQSRLTAGVHDDSGITFAKSTESADTANIARDILLNDQQLWPWIKQQLSEQVNYHHRRAHDEHELRHRVHRIAFVCFVLTGVSVALHLILHSHWLSIAAAFFPSLAAALTGVIAHSESERLEIDSTRMVSRLRALLDTLPSPSTELSARGKFVERCLDVLLSDVDDWHVYAKEKTLTLA